ncbi:hypothetical protein GGH12_000669 [Coemansia sp. RSA 1822]|nr:hypothetical protein LPJ76_001563 [Coemansia sp. RSA 638]KAJ2126158.1 hypothetical protein IW147_000309 [Coemansia sp. RSA 720]KAJ2545005.1 hypothetical protein GGF49_000764 [Coemansia sp. RSA 1853]KAJ2566711.1 hypothetical protein GGH12_000669 [Coemansia sp. RSA 1822]
MGILKRIKNSYVFTQLEVGKYTKRRVSAQNDGVRAATTEQLDEFDRAAAELRAEQMADAERVRRGMRSTSQSVETLAARGVARVRSSMDLTATQRERLGGRTAVSTPNPSVWSPSSSELRSPSSSSGPRSPTNSGPRSPASDSYMRSPTSDSYGSVQPRPRPARTGRGATEMQSVYFAPGRNVTTTNQQKQRQSVYPTEVPTFDKNSASSTDYYVYAPTSRQMASAPLDARRRELRGIIGPEPHGDMHRREELNEVNGSTNPFVERRRKAQKMVVEGWGSATPFDDPLVGSGRGGIDPNHPRKYLHTPVYANQTGSAGLDLLA